MFTRESPEESPVKVKVEKVETAPVEPSNREKLERRQIELEDLLGRLRLENVTRAGQLEVMIARVRQEIIDLD